jgi:hypothetical protein
MGRLLTLVLVSGGCGRVDFDPLRDGATTVDGTAACTHTFCDDFDRTTPPVTGWSSDVASDGTLVIDDTTSVSAPSSLRVDAPLPGPASMFLVEDLPGMASAAIHVEFELAVGQRDDGAEVDLMQLTWLPAPPPCTLFGYFIVKDDTGPMELQETFSGCGAANSNDTFPFGIADGFHHVAIDISLGAQAATRLHVAIDGTTVVDKPADRDVPASALELRLGEGTRTPSVEWIVHYDDVIVDLE